MCWLDLLGNIVGVLRGFLLGCLINDNVELWLLFENNWSGLLGIRILRINILNLIFELYWRLYSDSGLLLIDLSIRVLLLHAWLDISTFLLRKDLLHGGFDIFGLLALLLLVSLRSGS